MQAQVLLSWLVLILCSLVGSTSYAEVPPEWEVTPEISELIETIKKHEKPLVNYGYDVRSVAQHVIHDGREWQPIGEELDPFVHTQIPAYDANILWEVGSNRYHVHVNRFSIGSNGRFWHMSDKFSDDGEVFKKESQHLSCNSKPDWTKPPTTWDGVAPSPPTGRIAVSGSEAAMIQNGLSFLEYPASIYSIGWATPHVYSLHEHPMTLSELLEKRVAEKHEIISQNTDDGRWDIHFGHPYGFRILYAPAPGRVEQLTWGACVECDIKAPLTFENMIYQRIANIMYEDNKDRIPSRVVIVEAWGNSPGYQKGRKEVGQVLTLTNRRHNQELKPEDFRIQFQPGTRVTDHEREVKERTRSPFRSLHELLGIPQRQQP